MLARFSRVVRERIDREFLHETSEGLKECEGTGNEFARKMGLCRGRTEKKEQAITHTHTHIYIYIYIYMHVGGYC